MAHSPPVARTRVIDLNCIPRKQLIDIARKQAGQIREKNIRITAMEELVENLTGAPVSEAIGGGGHRGVGEDLLSESSSAVPSRAGRGASIDSCCGGDYGGSGETAATAPPSLWDFSPVSMLRAVTAGLGGIQPPVTTTTGSNTNSRSANALFKLHGEYPNDNTTSTASVGSDMAVDLQSAMDEERLRLVTRLSALEADLAARDAQLRQQSERMSGWQERVRAMSQADRERIEALEARLSAVPGGATGIAIVVTGTPSAPPPEDHHDAPSAAAVTSTAAAAVDVHGSPTAAAVDTIETAVRLKLAVWRERFSTTLGEQLERIEQLEAALAAAAARADATTRSDPEARGHSEQQPTAPVLEDFFPCPPPHHDGDATATATTAAADRSTDEPRPREDPPNKRNTSHHNSDDSSHTDGGGGSKDTIAALRREVSEPRRELAAAHASRSFSGREENFTSIQEEEEGKEEQRVLPPPSATVHDGSSEDAAAAAAAVHSLQQQQLVALGERAADAEATAHQLREQCAESQSARLGLEGEVAAMQGQLGARAGELAALQGALDARDDAVATLEADLAGARAEAADAVLAADEETAAAITASDEESARAAAALHDRLDGAEGRVVTLEAELADAATAADADATSAVATCTRCSGGDVSAEDAVAVRLEAGLSRVRAEVSALQAACLHLAEENGGLRRSNDAFRRFKEEVAAEIAVMPPRPCAVQEINGV